jgi:transcriptional regulator with XRE-family HTH domain
LASNAGLSKGFLSEIEHGLALPSLTTLVRLAGQLTLPLHELLRLPPPARKRATVAGNGRNGRKSAPAVRRGRGPSSTARV